MGKSAPKFKDIDLDDIYKNGKRPAKPMATKLARKRMKSAKETCGAVLESPDNKGNANIKKGNIAEAANASPETALSDAKLELAARVKNAVDTINEKAFDAQGIISEGTPDQADKHDEAEIISATQNAKTEVAQTAEQAQAKLSLIDITAKITEEPVPDLGKNLSEQAKFDKDREIYVDALKKAFITEKEKSYRESLQDDYQKFEKMEPLIQDGERLYAEFKSLCNQLPSKSAIKYQQSLDELMKRNKIIQASGDEITPLKQSVDGLNNLNNKIKEYIDRQARKKPQTNKPVLKIVPVNQASNGEERRRSEMEDWLKDNQRTSHEELFKNNTEEPKQKKPVVIDETIVYDEGNMPGASTEDEIYAGYKLDDAERKIEEMKSETRRRSDISDWLKDNQGNGREASPETSTKEARETKPKAGAEEVNAIEQEFEDMAPVDKEKIGIGVHNFGFAIEKWKQEKLAKIIEGLIPKKKSGEAIQDQGTLARFMHSLKENRQREARNAEDKIIEISDRKKENKTTDLFKHKFGNWGKPIVNIIKYGRIVTDFTGVTFALPLRYMMLCAHAFSEGTDAMKTARLENEKVIEKTRIKDIEEAAREAWRIYNQAKGDKDAVSKEELQRAYAKNIPKDLLTRLAKAPEPGTSSSILEKVFRRDAAGIIKRIDRKINEVEHSSRPAEVKAEETQKILTRFKDYLDDYDAIISRYGTVDTLAMAAKYANFAGKTTVNAMMVETLAESVYKLYQKFPEILSYSQNRLGSLFAGANSGEKPEVTPAPRPAGAPSPAADDKSDYARNAVVSDLAGNENSALSDQSKTEQPADASKLQPENASLEQESLKPASDIKAEITNTSGSRLAHFHGNPNGGVMEIERGSIEGALKDFLINQEGLDPEAAGQAADEAARDYATKMKIDFDQLNHIHSGAKISFTVEGGKVNISGLQDDGFGGLKIEENGNTADIGNEAAYEPLKNHPGKMELPVPKQFNSEELDALKDQKKIIFQNGGLEKIVDYYADHKGLNTEQKDYMQILLKRLSDESIHKSRPMMLKAIGSALKAYMSLSDKTEA